MIKTCLCAKSELLNAGNKKSSQIQLGSEIQPFDILKHLKSRLFKGPISNGLVFKWLGFGYDYTYRPNHLKTGPFIILMFFDNMAQNGAHLYGFQMSGLLDFRSHSKFGPFEIQTGPNFRSPLYSVFR